MSTTQLRSDIHAALEVLGRPATIAEVRAVLAEAGTDATYEAVAYASVRMARDLDCYRSATPGKASLLSLRPIRAAAPTVEPVDMSILEDKLVDVAYDATAAAMEVAGVDRAWLEHHRPTVTQVIGDAVETATVNWLSKNTALVAASIADAHRRR